jgi:hypothetical protein
MFSMTVTASSDVQLDILTLSKKKLFWIFQELRSTQQGLYTGGD